MANGKCSRCGIELSLENSNPSIALRRSGRCRGCDNARFKELYQKDPKKYNDRGKKWIKDNWEKRKKINSNAVATYRFKRFGITQEQFDFKFEQQGGLCKICKKPMQRDVKNLRPCQDHNHVTGELRDLLCSSCNLLLGNCFENKEILASAIQYLQKHTSDSLIQVESVTAT
jgi:Recombination endonuclease VII